MAKVTQDTPVKNIIINQGEDYRFQMKLFSGTDTNKVPMDITGYVFTCKVREEAGSDAVALTADCTILDSTTGTLEIHFKADDSDNLSLTGTYYGDLTQFVYDVFMKDTAGTEKRILCGYAYISPSVSNR